MISDLDILAALPAMWRYARSLRGNDDPEDLLQITCEKALRKRDRCAEGEAEPWLIAIMRNAHLTLHRNDKRPHQIVFQEGAFRGDPPALKVPDRQDVIVYAIEVMNAVARLPPEYRRLLALHAAGHSKQEAADIEGIPLGTQSSRMNRARARLMEMLK